MKRIMTWLPKVLVVLLLGLLVGCGQSQIQVGWVESNTPGRFQAYYAAFSGSEVRMVRADAGKTLIVCYEAKVTRGTLAFRIATPSRAVIWDVRLDKDTGGAVELALEQGGRYVLLVHGDDTAGSFDLSWQMTETVYAPRELDKRARADKRTVVPRPVRH